MELPSDTEIWDLHKKYAPHARAFEVVRDHSNIVADIAAALIATRTLDVDARLVHAAVLLHDIGYYQLYDETGFVPSGAAIKHGVLGSEVLRKEGLPEAVCRIAERHTGVGLRREHILAWKLPLPARDLVPETPEEWLVLYADKFHTKSILAIEPGDITGWFNTPDFYIAHTRRYGEDNVVRFTELMKEYGKPDVEALSARYKLPIDVR
ncbi:MAG TPA: HDIG domain-containing protein [Candidatus Saccharimonadia bacterium]|nr:HDIG domain-containing protein [Candidatus Saccharimonadia bacterium]